MLNFFEKRQGKNDSVFSGLFSCKHGLNVSIYMVGIDRSILLVFVSRWVFWFCYFLIYCWVLIVVKTLKMKCILFLQRLKHEKIKLDKFPKRKCAQCIWIKYINLKLLQVSPTCPGAFSFFCICLFVSSILHLSAKTTQGATNSGFSEVVLNILYISTK